MKSEHYISFKPLISVNNCSEMTHATKLQRRVAPLKTLFDPFNYRNIKKEA